MARYTFPRLARNHKCAATQLHPVSDVRAQRDEYGIRMNVHHHTFTSRLRSMQGCHGFTQPTAVSCVIAVTYWETAICKRLILSPSTW